MSILNLVMIIFVVVASGGILIYFIWRGIVFDRRVRTVDTTVVHHKEEPNAIKKQLRDLEIPPEKAEQAAQKITQYVTQQVQHQTEVVRKELTKEIEVREQAYKQVKTEYETVQKNYQKLGKQKRQTEAVVRNIAKGLIVVNDAGEVLFVNPVAEKILGVKPSSLLGKSIATAKGDHVITMVDESGSEVRNIAGQDSNVKDIIKESTAVIEGESGQTKGTVSILTGVTQQKKVDDYKTEFVANISHEFRTPLICIQKSIMAIQDELNKGLTDHQKNYIDIAMRNARRLEKMVNDILDMSKIQSGKMQLRHEIFSLQLLVKEVKNTFTVWGKDKSIEIVEDVAQEAISVEADQERLGQVLINLVSNAMKFTPRGGKITVEVKEVDAKNAHAPEDVGMIQLGVRDTGPGLSDEDRKKLFQKFSHAKTVATAGEKGTGLGLTIAKEIVELHHGRIWVESEEGKGSYFAFVIPKRPHAAEGSGASAVA